MSQRMILVLEIHLGDLNDPFWPADISYNDAKSAIEEVLRSNETDATVLRRGGMPTEENDVW